ncbi:MFS transporter [Paraburkholderia sp. CNPSo 3076]|uniref:MFS transporter n=1 Tax=Paraburkholderia sp. CNPSo 3076 TaxID=2940936 RepID=UPI002251C5DA|nr:MFS transporter [Paraburkholderia sp. CNPSo 3076]MCX5537933.1 MFS transporter [Paraburkholderia sp. CNPSo 3076]
MLLSPVASPACNAAIRKCLLRLLPFLVLMYVIAFIDRANVGFAKATLQTDTGLSNAAFAFGAGIFFISYAIFEVPSNLALHRFGARLWMSRIMVTWGIVSAGMAFAHDATTFYALRVLLGAAEAGFFPGVILYLTYWFPKHVRSQAMGVFYFGLPLALVLGGPLSGFLLQLQAPFGLKPWQWMFVVEGLLASIVGVIAFFYLNDGPDKADWLADDERRALTDALSQEDAAKLSHGPATLRDMFRSPRLAAFCLVYFTVQMSVYGVVFYLPTRIAELSGGKVDLAVGLLTTIPWLCALGVTWWVTRLADRTGTHRRLAALMLVCAGCGIAASALSSSLVPVIVAFCFAASGFVSVQPLYWTLPTNYLGGVAAAGGIALINSLGNVGGFVAPNLKTWTEQAFADPRAGMLSLACVAFAGAVMLMLMRRASHTAQPQVRSATT